MKMATTANFKNPEPPPPEPHVWVYGKAWPGWYIAKWRWDGSYFDHLKSLGYEVRSSVGKPVE